MKKTRYDDIEFTGGDAGIQKVLKHQQTNMEDLSGRLTSTDQTIDHAIAESERVLRQLRQPVPTTPTGRVSTSVELPPLRPWSTVLADAEKDVLSEVSLADLLSTHEIAEVEGHVSTLRGKFDADHRLDGIDWAIAGVAGVIAALVDTFLVKMPSSPGLFGAEKTSGGPLSDFIKERLKRVYTPEQIAALEKKYAVPYDIVNSHDLVKRVSGLGPRTHRFQSLGHDPILGFLFGTYDILRGTMTAVDSSGNLIVQAVTSPHPGMSVFTALSRQFGHLRSDLSTPAGLPAPLMPLLQFIQAGRFGKGERTIGEITRLMYAKGYDFGHFLAMSVPVLIIEVLVRFSYCVKRLMEGYDLSGSIPLNVPGQPRQPKLQTMLFVAHLISTAVNGGRVYLTKNPLAINYPQWVTFAKSSLQQAEWILFEKEDERLAYVQARIDRNWNALNRDLSAWWGKAESAPCTLSLP